MEAPCLLFQKNFRQTFDADFLPEAVLADIVILAEDSAQIAMAEKHCTAAFRAADRGFLPVVAADEGHLWQERCAAEAKFACGAVSAAIPWADTTLRQSRFHFFHGSNTSVFLTGFYHNVPKKDNRFFSFQRCHCFTFAFST